MKKTSIFSYDKKADCSYCALEENGSCSIGSVKKPCERFRYDVFKRKPRQSPTLQEFDEKDFQI